MSLLAYYEAKAKDMSSAELHFAIADVKDTLEIWKGTENEYTRKLLAEFDAYTVERNKRQQPCYNRHMRKAAQHV